MQSDANLEGEDFSNQNSNPIKEEKKYYGKVEKIWEYSLDSIPSPSPSVKIQIIGGKVYLR